MAIFGVEDNVILEKGKIVVVDGIAGAGKSSALHAWLTNKGISYGRYTSTNALKRDASNRYNMEVKTIAAGLFTTNNMKFYDEFKAPEYDVVVADEILQTSPRVFEWAIEFKDECKIFMLTDSAQLLAPEQEEEMEDAFNEFIKRDDVVYIQLNQTLRARDQQTKDMYEELYLKSKTIETVRLNDLCKMFKTVKYENIDYESDKLYITHTNEIESFIYKDWQLGSRQDLELIAKGRISSKEKFNPYNYPIMSYGEATKAKMQSHLEVANIGSTNRMQGKETANGTYFIVERDSVVTMRELYTMVTRNWNISNITVVVIDIGDSKELRMFKGLPVKRETFLKVDADCTTLISEKQMKEIFEANPDSLTTYYNKDVVLCRKNSKIVAFSTSMKKFKSGQVFYDKANDMAIDVKPVENSRKSTAGSLIRKDATMNFSYCNEMYSILDKVDGINHLFGIHKINPRKSCKYQVDIFSAYMAVLSNCKMPADGFIEYSYNPDMINIYLYGGTVYSDKSLVTDNLKTYVEVNNLGTCKYLFSVPAQKGCMLGEVLKQKAYKSIEDKKDIKNVHYGYYQKKYLELAPDKSCYLIDESHKYEILMVAILSELLFYMSMLNDALNGSYICIDAVHFNYLDDTTADTVKSILPDWFDWRIKDNDTGITLYQTYEDLKSKEDLHREACRERQKSKRANMTEEEKEEKRKKDAERKRIARAKKKNQEP